MGGKPEKQGPEQSDWVQYLFFFFFPTDEAMMYPADRRLRLPEFYIAIIITDYDSTSTILPLESDSLTFCGP